MILATLLLLIPQQPGGGRLVADWEHNASHSARYVQALAAPDVTGDGRDDWLLWSDSEDRIFLLSGADGAIAWERHDHAFRPIALADLEQDGRFEILLGGGAYLSSSADVPAVTCLDAHDGSTRWAYDPASGMQAADVLRIEDVDGDGWDEVLATTDKNYATSATHLACLEADGSERWARKAGGLLSNHVDAVWVDLDDDGALEVLITESAGESQAGFPKEGVVRVREALDGSLRWETAGGAPDARLGQQWDLRDLDGDGRDELVTRNPNARTTLGLDAGTVVVLDVGDGSERWRVEGWEAGQRAGSVVTYGDADRDGAEDVFLGLPETSGGDGAVVAVSGLTGTQLWRATDWPTSGERHGRGVWYFDNPAAPHPWLIADAGADVANTRELAGFDFRDARTGQRIGAPRLDVQKPGAFGPQVELADADGDGRPEVYFGSVGSSTGQVVGAVDASGLRWKVAGSALNYGGMHLLPPQAGAPWRLVTSQQLGTYGIVHPGKVRCFAAIDGRELWGESGFRTRMYLGNLLTREPAFGDGGRWIAVRHRNTISPEAPSGMRVYDTTTGEAVVGFRQGTSDGGASTFGSRWGPNLLRARDSDGDGLREWLAVGDQGVAQYRDPLRKRPQMAAAPDTLSVSRGGTVHLEMNFGAVAAWYEYRVLMGAHGPGTLSGFALDIPLRFDRAVAETLAGTLPEHLIRDAHDVLSPWGRATARVVLPPGRLPVGMVGRSLHFCAVARPAFGEWEFASIPVELRLLP